MWSDEFHCEILYRWIIPLGGVIELIGQIGRNWSTPRSVRGSVPEEILAILVDYIWSPTTTRMSHNLYNVIELPTLSLRGL